MFAAQNILLWVKGGKHLVDTFQCHLQHAESDENNMADPFPRHPAAVGGRLKTGVSHSCWTVSDEKAWPNGSISSSVHHFFRNIAKLLSLNEKQTDSTSWSWEHDSSLTWTLRSLGSRAETHDISAADSWLFTKMATNGRAVIDLWKHLLFIKCDYSNVGFCRLGKKNTKKQTVFSCKVLSL